MSEEASKQLLCCCCSASLSPFFLVAPGLEDGISQLSLGDHAKLTIPSEKAFGKKGLSELLSRGVFFRCTFLVSVFFAPIELVVHSIPPDSDLVFLVELVSFG